METLTVPITRELKEEILSGYDVRETLALEHRLQTSLTKVKSFGKVDMWNIRRGRKPRRYARMRSL
jgi:hypothetical protein